MIAPRGHVLCGCATRRPIVHDDEGRPRLTQGVLYDITPTRATA